MLTRKNKLVTRKDLDAAQYANIENGDLLSDEHPGAKLLV